MTDTIRNRLVISLLLILSPLLLMFWTVWYHHTYSPSKNPANYAALVNLHGKANICDKNIFNDHLPLCAEVDNFCRTVGKSNPYCPAWLHADEPYRYFFWVSVALALLAWFAGCVIALITLQEYYQKLLKQ